MSLSRWAVLALMLVGGGVLAGCASDPRYAAGLEWVMSNEAEKKRLQAQGFPQYSDGPGG